MLIAVNKVYKPIDHSAALVSQVRQVLSNEQNYNSDGGGVVVIGLNASRCLDFVDILPNMEVPRVRDVFGHAFSRGAHTVALCQTRAEAECQPRANDLALTNRLIAAGELLGIHFLDHLMVELSTGIYFSCRDQVSKPDLDWPGTQP